MTAPIDIACPFCAATAGNYCTTASTDPKVHQRITFHHAERIDAAVRKIARRQNDPCALREALRVAVARLKNRPDLDNGDLSFIATVKETFDL